MVKWMMAAAAVLALAGCGKEPPTQDELSQVASKSDDPEKHEEAFIEAAREIAAKDQCDIQRMIENAGFWRAPKPEDEQIYFIYCSSPMHLDNRYYLNAETGDISQIKSMTFD